jgi:7-cyano-7-deazaguanine synthase
MAESLAVVLTSGGMDSAVTLAVANEIYHLALLHLNYGQRTESREQQAFQDIAAYYGVDRTLVVDVGHFVQIGGSSLTDQRMSVSKANLENAGIPTSYVPFRNANILSIATSWAEVLGGSALFVGAVEEDSSGYPDCRREFYDAFERVIDLGTKPGAGIKIHTPLIHLQKHEIVRKGIELGVPFELTWSCYQSETLACGVCDSCAFRLRGFQQAGMEDPIAYLKRPFYS